MGKAYPAAGEWQGMPLVNKGPVMQTLIAMAMHLDLVLNMMRNCEKVLSSICDLGLF